MPTKFQVRSLDVVVGLLVALLALGLELLSMPWQAQIPIVIAFGMFASLLFGHMRRRSRR